jgi:hypothetical protein
MEVLVLETAEAAAQGSVEAAITLLRDYAGVAEYNKARRAIQVRGCNDRVMSAHIPLTAA